MGVNVAFDIVDNTDDVEPQIAQIKNIKRLADKSTNSNSKSGDKKKRMHPKIEVPEEIIE
jgi:hypothetical protein